MPSTYTPPRFVRPSGLLFRATPVSEVALSPDDVRTYQSILDRIGFPVGSVTDRTMARATLEPDASIPTNVPGATPIFTHSFLDPTVNLGSNTATQTPTNPLLVLGVIAGLATAAVAVMRYYDDRRAR